LNLKTGYNKDLEFETHFQIDKSLSYENFQNYESFYAEVYQQLFQSLFSYGMQICGNKELVKDSIQDLFSELWKNQRTLTRVKYVKPYLLKCLKRKIKRTLGKGKQLSVEGSFEFEISPETKLISNEQQDKNRFILNKTIQSLTERQREAIYLKFYGNLSYEEVAKVLNIKTKASYKLISRALSSLKLVIKMPY
jgi:RNA polymerase sigma factor (sigma-70 family)